MKHLPAMQFFVARWQHGTPFKPVILINKLSENLWFSWFRMWGCLARRSLLRYPSSPQIVRLSSHQCLCLCFSICLNVCSQDSMKTIPAHQGTLIIWRTKTSKQFQEREPRLWWIIFRYCNSVLYMLTINSVTWLFHKFQSTTTYSPDFTAW